MKKLLAIIVFAVMLFAFAVTAYAAETVTLNAPLDFTAETLPVPGTNDLWSYDEATKTLTLKDGLDLHFTGFNDETNSAIILPDGATIVVEGEVNISVYEYNGISAMGDLDIEFADGALLKLTVGEDYYGYESVYALIANGNLTVTGPENTETLPIFDINSEDGCIRGYNAAMTYENIRIDFYTGGSAIYSSTDKDYAELEKSGVSFPITLTNVTSEMTIDNTGIGTDFGEICITDCDIEIYTDDEVIYTTVGDIKIIKSELIIDTDNEEGISTYDYGDLYITESTVSVKSEEDGIEINGNIFITDSTVTVKTDEEEGIDAGYVYDYIEGKVTDKGGNITITGSNVTVDVKTDGKAIGAWGNLTITNSEFDMEILDKGDGVKKFYHLLGVQGIISIDGQFVLESEGTEIYRGEYTSDLEYDASKIDGNWIAGWKTLVIIGEDGTITEAYRIYSIHTHKYVSNYDEENHWDECKCNDIINEEPHTYEPKIDDNNHWEECECGFKINEEAHTYELKLDDNNHWNECECGLKINEEAHTHEPKLDDEYHWEECGCGHIINKELHTYEPEYDSKKHWKSANAVIL